MSDGLIQSIIVDDDPFIIDLLKDKIEQYLPRVKLIGTANNGAEGLKVISELKPDIVFLDVEMDDMTGFEMLSEISQINFQIIFVTSFSHYAIKAIRFNALDYLVKPIDLGELKKAINRFKQKERRALNHENLELALQNLNSKDVSNYKMILQTQEGELRLILKDIIRIEGDRNYSNIYMKSKQKKLVTKTLADLEHLLYDKGFFRSHKSYLINGLHIASYSNSNALMMSDNSSVPISRRKKIAFRDWYNDYKLSTN
jgi:two-component system LytT family response regulator